jgi:hypothetical protein
VIVVEAMSSVTDRPHHVPAATEKSFVAKVITRDNGVAWTQHTLIRSSMFFTTESQGIGFGLSVCRSAWWKRTLPGNPDSSVALQFPLHAGAETFREGLKRIIRLPTRHRTAAMREAVFVIDDDISGSRTARGADWTTRRKLVP